MSTAAVALGLLAGCGPLSGPGAGTDEADKQRIAATLATFAQLACARLVEPVPDAELRAARVDPASPTVAAFFDAAAPRVQGCRAAADWDEVEVRGGSRATASDGGVSYQVTGADPVPADRLEVELRTIGADWWVVELTEITGSSGE